LQGFALGSLSSRKILETGKAIFFHIRLVAILWKRKIAVGLHDLQELLHVIVICWSN
jgi:hypothetical protein